MLTIDQSLGPPYFPTSQAAAAAATARRTGGAVPVARRVTATRVGEVAEVGPHRLRALSTRPLVWQIESFLTAAECERVIELSRERLRSSYVTGGGVGGVAAEEAAAEIGDGDSGGKDGDGSGGGGGFGKAKSQGRKGKKKGGGEPAE